MVAITPNSPEAAANHYLPKNDTDMNLVSFLRNSSLKKTDLEQSLAELLNPWMG